MMVMYRHVCNERDNFKKTEIYEKIFIFKNIQNTHPFTHTYTISLPMTMYTQKTHHLNGVLTSKQSLFICK